VEAILSDAILVKKSAICRECCLIINGSEFNPPDMQGLSVTQGKSDQVGKSGQGTLKKPLPF
jgi:hypothetical protein